MKMAGYVPDQSCVLHDLEEEDKEHILKYHSEKLAVAFGLMKTDRGSTIHVTKSLRVCNDCHSAFKYMSHIYGRKQIAFITFKVVCAHARITGKVLFMHLR